MSTFIESDPKAPFSIATTPKCRVGCYSISWIASLYPWCLPYSAKCEARQHQVLFFESLVWLDLGLNPVFSCHWRSLEYPLVYTLYSHTRTHTHTYTLIYIYIYIYIYMYISMCVHMSLHNCIYIHTYIYMFACVYKHINEYIHRRIYLYTYVCVHVCVCVFITKIIRTIDLIFIVMLTPFRPICPPVFFMCFMSKSGAYKHTLTKPFI